jgi:uncharacterized metal-binding protein YceD (DUF177 family)
MRLDISEILREVGKNLPYDIQEPPLVDEDVECIAPIQGRVTFNNTGGMLLVRGGASTVVALPCSRCGEYFEQPVDVTVDEQFELKHVSAGPRTLATVTIVEEDENPAAGKLFDGHVFDLTEMLRQYIVLEEPTRPLPPEVNGRCTHCHLRPEDVLQVMGTDDALTSAGEPQINPAFAHLGELLSTSDE